MSRARILVIDDDPLFRNLIVTMLRRDFVVSVASEGAEGFYKALEHPPDVAIVDVQMPGWDGLKTLKAFRGHPTLSDVKIVMLTADASKDTVLAAIHAGANDYLIKTHLSRESLVLKIDRMLPGAMPSPATPVESRPAAATPRRAATAAPSPKDEPRVQDVIDQWE